MDFQPPVCLFRLLLAHAAIKKETHKSHTTLESLSTRRFCQHGRRPEVICKESDVTRHRRQVTNLKAGYLASVVKKKNARG